MPELRPYQIEDVNFLAKLDTAGIFNQQRTGKTPTALKVLECKGCKKNLVVCPATAIYNWQNEYKRWLNKPCEVFTGTKKQIDTALQNWSDGAIISYGMLKDTASYDGMISTILKSNVDAVVIDEAHRIKSRDAAVTNAVFRLIHVPVRLALSGTPALNRSHEIWSTLHFLYPKHFNSYWKFIDQYFVKTLRRAPGGRQFIEIEGFKSAQAQYELQGILNRISVQRKRKDVMQWLPDKDYSAVELNATKEQIKYLDELQHYYETEHIITQGTLDRLIRYRQICNAPGLLDLKGKSPKIEWLKQYLKDYPDKPIVIFSKFTSFLKLIQGNLKEPIPMIIGETPLKQRQKLITDFQSGKINQLLLNIDACKEAITLDRAEAEIFLDKYPPAGDIEQAEDRFVSTTKDKADKPHEIIEVMIKDTYDAHLFELVRQRISETDVINDYKKYLRRT
jgi:SNF2 family DNA or RNA helicase